MEHESRQSVAELLGGGDRRSTGRADEVADRARADPTLMGELVAFMRHPDPVVAMRAADALEKATRERADALAPHRETLLALAIEATQQELRWHLAQLLPRLRLSPGETRRAVGLLERYLDDRSQIVRVEALQALADLATAHASSVGRVVALLEHHAAEGGPAVRARAARVLGQLRARS